MDPCGLCTHLPLILHLTHSHCSASLSAHTFVPAALVLPACPLLWFWSTSTAHVYSVRSSSCLSVVRGGYSYCPSVHVAQRSKWSLWVDVHISSTLHTLAERLQCC